MEPLISALLETVFGSLAEATGLSDWLRDRLGRDPEKLAFRLALTQALTDAAQEFPGANFRYFTETLRDSGGPLLARTLQPASPLPSATELTQLWLNHLTIDSVIHYRADFERFATLLLTQLQIHLANQPALQWIAQARQQQASHGELQRIAASLEESSAQSQTQLAALRAELSRLVATLETLTQPGANINTGGGSYLAGNAQAGRDWIGRDQITIKNYFVAGLARLVVDYSARIQEFLLEYLGSRRKKVPFGGRAVPLAALDAWLADPAAPPYYLLSAEAGRGKSALVCRWLAQLTTYPDLAVVFLPISIRFETATQDVVFAALAARLAAVFNEEMKAAALSAEEWKGVCQSYLRRSLPDGKRLLLILDGLDEATDWTPGRSLFPGDPPDGLRILVTARLRPGEANAQGWAATLGWQNPQLARTATLPPLDRRGVEEALASMGNPLDALATQVDVVGELHRLSEGDPLLVRLYVDELVNQGERVRQLQAEELQAIQPGLAGYFERWWQDQQEQWRKQQRDPIRQEQTLRLLLNALAAALGPLTHDDLAALHPDLGDGLLLKRLTQDVNRWLVGDGKAQGYSYSHPRLGYFFWEQLSHQEQAAWDGRFCEWGAATLAALNAEQLDPKAAPVYLLRHYANHLQRSHAPADAFYVLISDGWRRAWEVLDVSYGGFLNDGEQAWERATESYDLAKAGKAVALVQQIKAALSKASVIASGENMPRELLAQAVQAGLLMPVQALAMAKLAPADYRRHDMLTALIPHLSAEQHQAILVEALAVARLIKDGYSRANVLIDLALHLPAEQRQGVLIETLSTARSISYGYYRAKVLSRLAPLLHSTLLAEAVSVARSIEDGCYRAMAFSGLASYLPGEQRQIVLDEALTAARLIDREDRRIEGLASLAPHLSTKQLRDVMSEVLATARLIEDEGNRSVALERLAPHLAADLLGKALAVARSIKREGYRVRALSSLVPYLHIDERKAVIGEVLKTARSIDEFSRTLVLETLAPHMPVAMLGEAVIAARSIEARDYCVRALSSLAPYLSTEQRQAVLSEALVMTCSISYEENRAEMLGGLAPKLSLDLLGEALDAARSIKRENYRARALSGLALYLPTEQRQAVLGEALTAARSVKDEDCRDWALAILAPHFSTALLIEALTIARSIKQEDYRARALSSLALHFPADQRQAILDEALIAARSMKYNEDYVRVLSSLAPHLSAEQGQVVLNEVLTVVRSSNPSLVHWLSSFAMHFPLGQRQAILDEALIAARSIEDKGFRASSLGNLAKHLPPEQRQVVLDEALIAARSTKRKDYRTEALSSLAPYWPAEQHQAILGEALTAACSIQYKYSRSDTLGNLAQPLVNWLQVAPVLAYDSWVESLSALASWSRPEFLEGLIALMPFILALAGDEAPQAAEGIYHAIQEVCGWWP